MQNFEINLRKLVPIKDTPERLGYKEWSNIMYLNKDGLLQIGFVTITDDGQGRNVLKFPSNATHIVSNVKVTGQ